MPEGHEVIAVAKIVTPPVDWLSIAPEIALAAAGIIIVLGRSLIRRDPRVYDASLLTAVTGVIAAGFLLAVQWNQVRTHGPYQAIGGMVAVDGFGIFLGVVVVVSVLLVLMLSSSYVPREGLDGAEYLALVLFSATGMLAMTSANDLVVVFLALEILSIPLYVLAAFDRRRLASQEAGLKYFVLGAFSSAVFLYGVALVYGATGTTSLTGIAGFLSANTVLDNGVLLAGIALLLVGLGFKVAAAPFHMWTPDVYQGAPTPITAFMASATKAAGFAALLRVLATAFATYKLDWRPAIFALAVLSLVVGSVAAVVQTDIKRLLAYSSIAHAGYVLIGLQAGTRRGVAAALLSLLVYTFMAVGAFAVVALVARVGDEHHSLDEYRGLAGRQPMLAGALTFFLLAQAGVPLTGGFVAKLNVFAAGVAARSYALVIVGVLAAVVAAYVYLRVVVVVFAAGDEAPAPAGRVDLDAGTATVLAVTILITLVVGFLPGSFLHFARDATLLF